MKFKPDINFTDTEKVYDEVNHQLLLDKVVHFEFSESE